MTYDDQLVYTYPYSPTVPAVFNDVVLATPELVSPADQAVICARAGDTVTLEWSAIIGADFYVIQYSRNGEFSGPSLRASEVAAPTTQLVLTVGPEIKYGSEYYWRVMAYSTTGGASPMSKQRQFTVQCRSGGEDSDAAADICESVGLSMSAPSSANCGDRVEATLSYSTPPGYTIDNVQWDIDYDGILLIDERSATSISFYTESCGSKDVTLVITASVTTSFGSLSDTCEVSDTVFIRCEDPLGDATYIEDLNPCYPYAGYGYLVDPYDLPDPKVPSQYMISSMVSKQVYTAPEYHYYNFYDDQAGSYVSGYEYCDGYYFSQQLPIINYIDWESAQTKQIGQSVSNLYWDLQATIGTLPTDVLTSVIQLNWETDYWNSTYSFNDNGCSTQGLLLDTVTVDSAANTQAMPPIYATNCLQWREYEMPGGGYAPVIGINTTATGYAYLDTTLRKSISGYGIFNTAMGLHTYHTNVVYGYSDCGVLSELYTEPADYTIENIFQVGQCLRTTAGENPTLYFDTAIEGSLHFTSMYDVDLYITGTDLFLSWTTAHWVSMRNNCLVVVYSGPTHYTHDYKALSLYECP